MAEVMVTINGKQVMIPAPELTEDERVEIRSQAATQAVRDCKEQIIGYFLKKMEKEDEKYKDCGWSVDEFLAWLDGRSMGNDFSLMENDIAGLLTWCESPHGGKADMEEYLEQHISHKKAYRVTVSYKRTIEDNLDIVVLANDEDAVHDYLQDADAEDILDEIIEDRYAEEVEITDWGIDRVEMEECDSTEDYRGCLTCFDAEE